MLVICWWRAEDHPHWHASEPIPKPSLAQGGVVTLRKRGFPLFLLLNCIWLLPLWTVLWWVYFFLWSPSSPASHNRDGEQRCVVRTPSCVGTLVGKTGMKVPQVSAHHFLSPTCRSLLGNVFTCIMKMLGFFLFHLIVSLRFTMNIYVILIFFLTFLQRWIFNSVRVFLFQTCMSDKKLSISCTGNY